MANVTVASNASAMAGKWRPYYHKPFQLGEEGDGANSTDGNIYITQTVGSGTKEVAGVCIDEFNCGYYYVLIIKTSTKDDFYIEKYNASDDTLVDTIYASTTSGDGRFWASTTKFLTIDIGVMIKLSTETGFSDGDKFKIELPSLQTMKNRRIYHGGLSTYMRIPYEEGIAYHSDVIPNDLLGKNIHLVTQFAYLKGYDYGFSGVFSFADIAGNSALSIALEWQVNPDAATSSTAGDTDYSWAANENWMLGSMFAFDYNPNLQTAEGAQITGTFPASDVQPAATGTGDPQALNITCSGRAQHGRLKFEYMSGAGSPTMMAHNQFFPVVLTLG